MEHALATEMPLALFTTLAPIAAGAFIVLAIALYCVEFSEKQIKLLDKLSFIPLVVLAAAFIAAFFHLANPLNALNVVFGIGRSPMSNEILAGVIFGAGLLLYCILAVLGKLNGGARKIFASIVALIGLVFAFFIGNAYAIETIVSWNTPLIPLSIIGFALLGGAILGTLMIAAAQALEETRKTAFKPIMLLVTVLGFAVGLGCVWAHYLMVAGIETTVVSGAQIASSLTIYLVICTICMVIAFVCECISLFKSNSSIIPVLGLAFVFVAILIARLAFYVMQISVGL